MLPSGQAYNALPALLLVEQWPYQRQRPICVFACLGERTCWLVVKEKECSKNEQHPTWRSTPWNDLLKGAMTWNSILATPLQSRLTTWNRLHAAAPLFFCVTHTHTRTHAYTHARTHIHTLSFSSRPLPIYLPLTVPSMAPQASSRPSGLYATLSTNRSLPFRSSCGCNGTEETTYKGTVL